MLTILKHFLLTGIDGRKAIRRIAQPQPEGLRSSGLGAAPQQAEKPFVLWKRNGWFFAFVLQMHCLLLLPQEDRPVDDHSEKLGMLTYFSIFLWIPYRPI